MTAVFTIGANPTAFNGENSGGLPSLLGDGNFFDVPSHLRGESYSFLQTFSPLLRFVDQETFVGDGQTEPGSGGTPFRKEGRGGVRSSRPPRPSRWSGRATRSAGDVARKNRQEAS